MKKKKMLNPFWLCHHNAESNLCCYWLGYCDQLCLKYKDSNRRPIRSVIHMHQQEKRIPVPIYHTFLYFQDNFVGSSCHLFGLVNL